MLELISSIIVLQIGFAVSIRRSTAGAYIVRNARRFELKVLPKALRWKRPLDYYGPEDWSGDPNDDPIMGALQVTAEQQEWDRAYAGLSKIERLLYTRWGYY